MATISEVQLIEKIVRAKAKLEAGKRHHSDACALEDPESIAPCNCSAGAANAAIDAALRELTLT